MGKIATIVGGIALACAAPAVPASASRLIYVPIGQAQANGGGNMLFNFGPVTFALIGNGYPGTINPDGTLTLDAGRHLYVAVVDAVYPPPCAPSCGFAAERFSLVSVDVSGPGGRS